VSKIVYKILLYSEVEDKRYMDKNRLEAGMKKQYEADGIDRTNAADTLDDLGRYISEFAFGDIYSRDGLSLRDREMVTIAMLTAKGGCEPQLASHIKAGLHLGLSKTEIQEIIIQSCVYAGFPAAINAMNVLKSI
jgi:4-carboxymuconolactone decarboxylase